MNDECIYCGWKFSEHNSEVCKKKSDGHYEADETAACLFSLCFDPGIGNRINLRAVKCVLDILKNRIEME